jgi:hypothetical protein
VGPRGGLDAVVKSKIPGLEPSIIQPVAQSCTTELSCLVKFRHVLHFLILLVMCVVNECIMRMAVSHIRRYSAYFDEICY